MLWVLGPRAPRFRAAGKRIVCAGRGGPVKKTQMQRPAGMTSEGQPRATAIRGVSIPRLIRS